MPQYIVDNPTSYAAQIMALLAQIPNEYLTADEIARGLGEPSERVPYVRKKLNEAFKTGWLRRRRVILEVPYHSDVIFQVRYKKGWEWSITNKGLGYLDWLKEDVKRELEEETRRRALLRAKPRPVRKYQTIELSPELERVLEEAPEEIIEEEPEEIEAPPEYPALPPPSEEEKEDLYED